MKKLPVVYYQLKKLKEVWQKSNTPNKESMIECFNESMREVIEKYQDENAMTNEAMAEIDAFYTLTEKELSYML